MVNLKRIIEYGFYLFIFLLPWQTRLIWQDAYLNGDIWEYGRLSLYGTEILLWLVLGCYLFWLFKNKKISRINFSQLASRLKRPRVLIYWLAVIFLLIAGLSIIWSINIQLAYHRWLRLLEAAAILAMVLIFKFKLSKIAICWVASAGVQSVFAIWQFFNQSVFASKWLGLASHLPTVPGSIILQTASQRWLRAYGSLPHPNMLAGFLAIGLLFLFYLAFIAKNKNQRIFVLINLVVITPALFFSFSRSAWLGLIFCLAVLSFYLWHYKNHFWNKTFFRLMILFFLIVAILGFNFQTEIITRLTGQQYNEEISLQLRVDYVGQAWQLIQQRFFGGQGIGNYTLAIWQKINDQLPGYSYQPVHNLYLLIFTEIGIFGILIFGLILILLFWNLIKNFGVGAYSNAPVQQLEKMIVFLALILILIISLFDHYFWTLYFGVMVFWLILALNLKQLNEPRMDVN